MITTSTGQTPSIALAGLTAPAAATVGPALTMVSSDRMAGSIPVWTSGDNAQATIAALKNQAAKAADENRAITATPVTTAGNTHAFSFHDLLDMINPLQHIPVVNQIYRRLTGDTINPAMQVAGDAMYGGPLGGAISLANVITTQATGHDISGTVMAMVRGKSIMVPTTMVASAGDAATPALLPAVLRYTDAGAGQRAVYERVSASSDRMAGTMVAMHIEKGSAADGMTALAKAETANQVAAMMPAAGAAVIPKQSVFRSLHLNA